MLERRGDAIRFHPTLLELSAHYRFEPRPVAVARGNEKGRVERAIRYIRDNFFAGRQWQDLDDLNEQATQWCLNASAERACPEDRELTVRDAFEQEKPRLIALPGDRFPTDDCVAVSARKTPYIRFDLNDYSIPHTHVRKNLSVSACLKKVRILDGDQLIAEHDRHYGKGEQVEDDAHIEGLVTYKRQARYHRGQDRLTNAVPNSEDLLQQAAERGDRLSTSVNLLLQQLDDYGAVELEAAIAEALAQNVPHPNAVRQILERRREQRQQPPPIAIALTHNKTKNIVVPTASLSTYDQLSSTVDHDQTSHQYLANKQCPADNNPETSYESN